MLNEMGKGLGKTPRASWDRIVYSEGSRRSLCCVEEVLVVLAADTSYRVAQEPG